MWFKFRFCKIVSSVTDDVHSVSFDRSNQNLKTICNRMLDLNPLLNDEKLASSIIAGAGPWKRCNHFIEKETFTTEETWKIP